MATCSACGVWNIRPDDIHCGGCGASAVAFDLVGNSEFIAIPGFKRDFPVQVRVRNTGQVCLDSRLDSQPKNMVATFSGLPLRLRILPQEEGVLSFNARFDQQPEAGRHEIFVAAEQMRSLFKPITFFVAGDPEARITFTDLRDVIPLVPGEPSTTAVEIYNAGGCWIQVKWKKTPSWIKMPAPIHEVPPRTAVVVQALVQLPQESEPQYQGELHAVLAARKDSQQTYEDFSEIALATPKFPPVKPPSAVITWNRGGTAERVENHVPLGRLVPTERRRARFTLRNAGELPFEHVKIYARDAEDNPAFIVAVENENAAGLAPGGELEFHVRIDASRHACGSHRIPLLFDFGRHGARELTIGFEINPMKPYNGVVGIDFGTSYSCVARCDSLNSPATVIGARDQRNGAYIPSVLYFFSPDDYVFGSEAKQFWAFSDPGNSVFNVKRALTGGARTIRGVRFSPEDLVRIIMRELVSAAMRELNRIPTQLVATVPVGFSPRQREIVRHALLDDENVFGHRNILIVDEPTAAAMHYYFKNIKDFEGAERRNLLVFDFGGGTLDVSILALDKNGFTILGRRGNPGLGGVDMDRAVGCAMAERIARKYPNFELEAVVLDRDEFDARFTNSTGMLRMRIQFARVSEDAKMTLAGGHDAAYGFPAGELKTVSGVSLSLENNADRYEDTLKADAFPEMIAERLDEAVKLIHNALEAAGLAAADIDIVLMTGQVCKTKCLRERVREVFKGSKALVPDFESDGFDIKSCVAMGAAKMAQGMSRRQFAAHVGVAIGSTGYFNFEGAALRFFEVLPDRHPYGQEGEKPVDLALDDQGHCQLRLYQNTGRRIVMENDNDPEFIELGYVDVNLPQKPNANVDLRVGLDENGNITARVDDVKCPVVLHAEYAKEGW